jgi:hypothetical protein
MMWLATHPYFAEDFEFCVRQVADVFGHQLRQRCILRLRRAADRVIEEYLDRPQVAPSAISISFLTICCIACRSIDWTNWARSACIFRLMRFPFAAVLAGVN